MNEAASHCRYCRNELVTGEQKADPYFGPESKFDAARRWVPSLNSLIEMLPQSNFKKHLQDGLHMRGRLQSMAMYDRDEESERQFNESNVGLERPPFEQERSIIREVFLHLKDAGVDIEPMLQTPKLRVLKFTKEYMDELYKVRLNRQTDGKECKFCKERNDSAAQACEFCKSNFVDPPKREARRFRKNAIGIFPLDKGLLKDVLLHIAVNRALTGGAWRTEMADVLSKHDICNADVEKGLGERQFLIREDMHIELPMSDWQRSLMMEGLDDGMDGYHAIHNIIEMGQTCLQEEFNEEAELVLNFAMAVAETHRLGNVQGLEAMREPLKTSGWMALSQLYESTGRYAEAEAAHSKMFQLGPSMAIPGLDEILKATMEMLSPQRSMRQADLCVKQEKYDEAIDLYKKALSALDKQENKPFVGFSKMAGLIHGEPPSSMTTPTAEDFDTPPQLQKDEQAKLSDVSDLVLVSTAHRVGVMKKLAEVYIAKGDLATAGYVLDESMELAEQLNEPYQALVADVCETYGRLNILQGKLPDAEAQLRRALEYYSSVKDPMDPDEFQKIVDKTSDSLADCLEKQGKNDEAAKYRKA
ncbi:MAG: tetratricopeptide repeat protein [Candidatus Melainabacteria bacterium]|nr:tetratricopeptide repeat protein [Candidatus Melainabacteria bacterium]